MPSSRPTPLGVILSRMQVNVTLSVDLDQIATVLQFLSGKFNSLEKLMAALDDAISALQAEVAKQTTVDASAVTLIQGLATQLAAALAAAANAGATTAQLSALTALQTALANNDTSLGASVSANTAPVAPVPPTPPAA